ncbi:major histocompatibility complex class I-related gene protein-like [Simochromis diagramma]|uniref:major histocompatibility complex class I-related gene protein-like n=1 Tax=Simochromis diagramma TaxID=43689 RepID=UPI001A7ECBD5|nr:major histocompatibility complex class I-related gene protein-like [Simochromis diagramma]
MNTIVGDRWESSTQNCRSYRQIFKSESNKFKEHFNHTGGLSVVRVVQQMAGCEWDDVTGDIIGYQQYSYDGEDLISLDLKTLTWITARPQAVVTKHEWDGDKYRCEFWKNFVMKTCPEKLQKYLKFWKSSQQKTAPHNISEGKQILQPAYQ